MRTTIKKTGINFVESMKNSGVALNTRTRKLFEKDSVEIKAEKLAIKKAKKDAKIAEKVAKQKKRFEDFQQADEKNSNSFIRKHMNKYFKFSSNYYSQNSRWDTTFLSGSIILAITIASMLFTGLGLEQVGIIAASFMVGPSLLMIGIPLWYLLLKPALGSLPYWATFAITEEVISNITYIVEDIILGDLGVSIAISILAMILPTIVESIKNGTFKQDMKKYYSKIKEWINSLTKEQELAPAYARA